MEIVLFNIVLVSAIIYIVPFLVYGLASVVTDLKTPEGVSPSRFLISVLICKVGTAIAGRAAAVLARPHHQTQL
ncbi:MAG: hypothetical protein HY272_07590 [Gammaproteobacteria bacterium]|nr:hypothetical protein [Gammaproteobacteria bacterium]